MIGRTNVGSGGKKSLILPTNPELSIKSGDATLTLSWTQPETEVEVDHYNIYTSLTEPSSLKDMELAGSVIAKESVQITFKSSIDNYSKDGLSISKISDGKYSVVSDGSGSGGISIVCGNFIKENGKTYKLYGCPSGGSSTTYCLHTPDNSTNYDDFGNGVSFVSSEDVNNAYLFFSLYLNVEYDVIFEPKIDKINNSFTLTNLTNDQTYYVGIQAVSVEGYENASIWKVKNDVPLQIIWVAVGSGGASAYSTDGEAWVKNSTIYSTSYSIYGVAYGGNKFVCVGNYPPYYSEDGKQWIKSTMETTSPLYSVCYGNGRFVAVGGSGKSYYSTNGTSWVAMSGLNTSKSYNGVTYGNDRFVAVGYDGASNYSTDGINWVAMNGLNTSTHHQGVTYGNGRFVAVGESGISYYSTDGVNWIAMSGLDTSTAYRGVTYGKDRFVCVGGNGYSYYSINGTSWVAMSRLASTTYNGVTNNKWNVA